MKWIELLLAFCFGVGITFFAFMFIALFHGRNDSKSEDLREKAQEEKKEVRLDFKSDNKPMNL